MRQRFLACICGALLAAVSGAVDFEFDETNNRFVVKTLAAFDKCMLDFTPILGCLDALRRYADKHPNDAFQAARRAHGHYPDWSLLPFFELALRKRATDAQCSDEDVLLAVIAGLSRPSTDTESINLAREVTNKCWESVQEGLIEAVKQDKDNAAFKANVCPLLAAKQVAVASCDTSSDTADKSPQQG